MTRAFLNDAMADLGEDFDENLDVIRERLTATVHEVAEPMGLTASGVDVESANSGGVVLDLCIEGREQRVRVDLADDAAVRAAWMGPMHLDWLVRMRLAVTLRGVSDAR